MFIKLRNSTISGNIPLSLSNGELALNRTDQLLYYKHANGSILAVANGATIGIDSYARIRANGAFTKANGTFIAAHLSSNTNQIPANTSAYKVTYNTQNILIDASHMVGNSRVIMTSNGVYMVCIIGQVSKSMAGSLSNYCDYWIRKNEIDIAGSTTRTTLSKTTDSGVMVNNFVLNLVANDYIEIMQAVNSSTIGMGLTAATALAGGPSIPSISLTITKITN